MPSRPRAFSVTSYDSASRSTAAAVRTVCPPPVPTTYAEYVPSAVPPSRVSVLSATSALPPAGTVTLSAPRVKKPAGAGLPWGPVPVTVRSRVTSLVPRLRYVTFFVAGVSSVCGHCCTPKLTETGSATMLWPSALSTAIRPEPCWNGLYAPGLVEAVSAPFSSLYFQSGCCCLRSAAAPATCGVAIDVPEMLRYPGGFWPTSWSMAEPGAAAAVMSTPGAVTSGLMAPSPMRGPRLEKSASTSLSSTAPTVSAASALPGEPTVPAPSPSLPAAMANRTPLSADSLSTAASSGSISGVSLPPRLRLTMSAPCATAHSMPARMPESSPKPSSSSTLPSSSLASGATPLNLPPDRAPVPAAIEETCVPCPTRSLVSGEAVKFFDARIWSLRSGCVASTPVSRTAIFTPLPV
ncbi:hypothetical protein ACVWXU_003838 [Streptomyces sp. TE33382]